MSKPETVEERLHLAEVSLEVQAEILTNIQEMLLERDRLSDSVGRLGENAGSLSAALLQVEAQQRVLAQLGQDIMQVKSESATNTDVDTKVARVEATAERERRRIMNRVYAGAVVMLALLGFVSLGAVNAVQASNREDQRQCEQSFRSTAAVVSYLEDVREVSTNPVLQESAGEVIESLPDTSVDPEVACAQ